MEFITHCRAKDIQGNETAGIKAVVSKPKRFADGLHHLEKGCPGSSHFVSGGWSIRVDFLAEGLRPGLSLSLR